MKVVKTIPILLFALTIPISGLRAQEKVDTFTKATDNTSTKQKKVKQVPLTPLHWNTIKFNPTPMLVSSPNNITFSYERMINSKTSICIQVGYLEFPTLFADTVFKIITIHKGTKNGINVALDYRYYPFQRNRRPAPDGLYLGAYLSYYGFQFKNGFDILNDTLVQNGHINGKLNMVNLGAELGYQFIFWKRLSLDLILFGPSLSMMNGSLEIVGNLDENHIKNLDSELAQRLMDRFPLVRSLVTGEDLKFSGSKTSVGTGFRYSI